MNIVESLTLKKLKIATAESCTGGLLAGEITNFSGASDVFEYGFVTYSNEAKIKLLGVKSQTIEDFGVVSENVAMEMAKCVAKIGEAHIGVGITGFAGPSGENVGLVYIGYYVEDGVNVGKHSFCIRCDYSGTRGEIRENVVRRAIAELEKIVSDI